jgi:hypothetical protein
MYEKNEILRTISAINLTLIAMIVIYVFTNWALQVRDSKRFKITFTKNKK